jgi:hypothetical protein
MLASILALLPVAQAPAPGTIEWPFRVMESAIIVDSTVNGMNISCMFDTGFSGAYVLNDNVNVGRPTGTMMLRDFVGQFEAKTVNIRSLSMGQKKIDPSDMQIVQQPARDWSSSYGTRVDGIMGMEPLVNYVTQINFERSRFIFHPDSHDISKVKPDNKRTFLLRMLPKGRNSIELNVRTANGQKMTLALDTGNGFYATTHKDVLERIGLWKPGTNPVYTKTSWVASGPVDSFYVRMKDTNIYGVPVPESVWSIIDLPSSSADHDGTVGFQFLKNFNITIDFKRRLVLLENFTGRTADEPKAETGIFAFYDERASRMRIVNVTPGSPAAKAGIRPGDFLVSVDGNFIKNVSFERVQKMMEGALDSEIQVETSRGNALQRHTLKRAFLINNLTGVQ